MLVALVQNAINGAGRQTVEIDAHTIREVVDKQTRFPKGTSLWAISRARRIPEDEWDEPLPYDADLTLAPAIEAQVALLLVMSAISVGLSLALTKKQIASALGAAQRQGDETSPTYRHIGATSTTYGSGWAIPIVLGRHRVGGQVIGMRVYPAHWDWRVEVLRVLLAFCEGPIYSIGGEQGLPYAERDGMGKLHPRPGDTPDPIPTGIRLDGVELTDLGAEASIRLGHPRQSRLPGWALQTGIIAVNRELADALQSYVAEITETTANAAVIALSFPSGLYKLSGSTRVETAVDLRIEFRQVGGPWIVVHDPLTIRALWSAPVSFFWGITFTAIPGPYEVRITRITPRGDTSTVVDLCQWRSLTYEIWSPQTYPGLALMDLAVTGDREIPAQPQISCEIEGQLVQAWDATLGFVGPAWETDGAWPWSYEIGRNPAWLALWLCRDEEAGMGSYIKRRLGGTGAEELDLQSFRNWADYCDQDDPLDPASAKFRCDLVMDTPTKAFEQLIAICKTARAMPVIEGNKLRMVYDYRDAHGRGSNSVPARTAVAVINTSNVERVEIRWKDPSSTPNQIQAQYVDAARDYRHDTATIDDQTRTISARDGYEPKIIPERINLFGITNRMHVRREAFYVLAGYRLSAMEARVVCGIGQIPVQVGDLVYFQHECWVPDYTNATTSCRIVTDSPGTPVSSIVLDRDLQLFGTPPNGTGIFVSHPETPTFYSLTVNQSGTSISAGNPVPLWDPTAGGGAGAPASVLVRRGATVTSGKFAAFERLMVVTRVTITPEWQISIDLSEWDPAMHTDPDPTEVADFAYEVGPATLIVPEANPDPVPRTPDPVLVQASQPAGIAVAASEIIWDLPDSQRGREARVYARRAGETTYRLLGTGEGGRLPADLLETGIDYELVVLNPGPRGVYRSPYEETPTPIHLPEIQGRSLPAPDALAVTATEAGVRLSWRPVDGAEGYVIRRGGAWLGAQEVARTTETALEVPAPEVGTHRYLVRAGAAQGRLGDLASASLAWSGWPPGVELASSDELATWGGTADGLVKSGSIATHVAGKRRGTYTSVALDLGEVLEVWWSAQVDWSEQELQAVGADVGTIGADTGEWIAGADPTPRHPGIVWGRIGDDTGDIGEDPVPIRGLDPPDLGENVGVVLEARYHDGSTWGSWETYRPAYRLAQQIQVRATAYRRSLEHVLSIDRFLMKASA